MLTQRQTQVIHGQYHPVTILHFMSSVSRPNGYHQDMLLGGTELTTPAAGRPRPTAVPLIRSLAKW